MNKGTDRTIISNKCNITESLVHLSTNLKEHIPNKLNENKPFWFVLNTLELLQERTEKVELLHL